MHQSAPRAPRSSSFAYSIANTSSVAVGPVRQPSATGSKPPANSFNPFQRVAPVILRILVEGMQNGVTT